MKTGPFIDKLIAAGYLIQKDGETVLSEQGKKVGGQFKTERFGDYFLWPEDLNP